MLCRKRRIARAVGDVVVVVVVDFRQKQKATVP